MLLILLGVMLLVTRNIRGDGVRGFMLVVNLVWAVAASAGLVAGVDPLRVFYSWYYYCGPCAFCLLPQLALALGRVKLVNAVVLLSCVTCGFGLVTDYYTDIFSALSGLSGLDSYSDLAEVRTYGFRRAAFFFDSPANIFAFMSLGLSVCLWGAFFRITTASSSASLLFAGVISSGIFLTQTRAQWGVLAFVWIAGLAHAVRRSEDKMKSALIGLAGIIGSGVAILLATKTSQQQSSILERLQDFFSATEESNIVRYASWQDGFRMLGEVRTWIFGSGMGSGAGQVEATAAAIPNYESSFFLAVAEAGVMGLFVRYAPVLCLLHRIIQGGLYRHALGGFLLIWTLGWLLVTTVAPSAGAYHGLAALYLVLGIGFCCKEWEDQSKVLFGGMRLGGKVTGRFRVGRTHRGRQ